MISYESIIIGMERVAFNNVTLKYRSTAAVDNQLYE